MKLTPLLKTKTILKTLNDCVHTFKKKPKWNSNSVQYDAKDSSLSTPTINFK